MVAATTAAAPRPGPPPRAWAGATLLAGVAVLIALHLWRGESYWNYSEGVYILSARLLDHGADLYGTMVGAQPPGVFLLGGGILGLHDGIEWTRLVVGALQLGGGLIAAAATWRLSGSRVATLLTPPLVLLTPWAVHEHGALTPEAPAIPLLLGGALLVARPSTAAAGGAVAALAIALKYPFVLPVAGVVLGAADRWRAALGAAVTVAVLAALGLGVFGSGLIRDSVTAQLHSGHLGLHDLLGFWAQAGWNLAGLLAPAAALVLLTRRRVRDRPLGRAWLGLVVGLLATVLTNVKQGTGLNILVPVEAALVAPAVASVALLAGHRAWRVAAAACVGAVVLQTAALVVFPARTAWPFLYPGSQRGAWGRVATGAEVRATVAQVQVRCPSATVYSGPPYLGYLAGRRMPDGQPDGFITARSPTLRAVAARMATDGPRCP